MNKLGKSVPNDDIVENLHTHVTQNANGKITADFSRFEVDCH